MYMSILSKVHGPDKIKELNNILFNKYMQIFTRHVWLDMKKTTKQKNVIEHTYALVVSSMCKTRQDNTIKNKFFQ